MGTSRSKEHGKSRGRLHGEAAEAVLAILVAARALTEARAVLNNQSGHGSALEGLTAELLVFAKVHKLEGDIERVAEFALDDAIRVEEAAREHSTFLLYDLAAKLHAQGFDDDRARVWLMRAAQRVPWRLSGATVEEIAAYAADEVASRRGQEESKD